MTKKIKIFIIDDDYFNPYPEGSASPIRQYQKKLEEAGFAVSGASNWDEALKHFPKVLAKPPFDLVILDISMPLGESLKNIDPMGGLHAGLYVSQLLSERKQHHIILSNMAMGPIQRDFESGYLLEKYLKPNTLPTELARDIEELFGICETGRLLDPI